LTSTELIIESQSKVDSSVELSLEETEL
jgi:hypothetical protein